MSFSPATALCTLLALGVAGAAPDSDIVAALPGFNATGDLFTVYSGMLHVPGPVAGYASLDIHYQFHTSQRSPKDDPVVTWHQGGPGGSAIYGLYGEMGYFQLSDSGPFVNDYSWNKVANMLYLESPAGSTVGFSDNIGFSTCTEIGSSTPASVCKWNDTSQAEAYAHTLEAFFKEFPEFAQHDLYLTGESYAGQYLPNIADFVTSEFWPQKRLTNLKGIAVGNGCWGGTQDSVDCNGPNSQKNDVDLFFGKGMLSRSTRDNIYKVCGFDDKSVKADGIRCTAAIAKMDEEVYDNCPLTEDFLQRTGKSMTWLRNRLRESMSSHGVDLTATHEELKKLNGGFDWSCGAMGEVESFFKREEVQKALHLPKPNLSRFSYDSSGPASVLLYPKLVKKIRVLIYNGDADSCVPYIGNEEWTTELAASGVVKETKAWHPWYVEANADGSSSAPVGYATSYSVPETDLDFSFVTIRLSGHMVPNFSPAAGLAFFERFLAKSAL